MARRPEVVYFDLETGGLEPGHPNIQLAAIACYPGTVGFIDSFEAKILFDPARCTPEALEKNGYKAEDWAEALPEDEVVKRFDKFLQKHSTLTLVSQRTGNPYTVAKLIGYNAATFDGPRLKAMFDARKMFLKADMRIRCVLQRALWYFDSIDSPQPDDFKLATVHRTLGLEPRKAHEATADVLMTQEVDRELLRRFGRPVFGA